MKKLVIFLFMTFIPINTLAASIISYTDKNPGEEEFYVVNSRSISTIGYYEEDKLLKVHRSRTAIDYKVESKDRALEIIKALMDPDDKSLIELEEH